MIKVLGYETTERYTQIHWEQDIVEGLRGPIISLGYLEQYMGAYGTSYEETLDCFIADPAYDDINLPFMDDPEAPAKMAELLKLLEGRIDWSAIDKAQLIADMSLEDDTAETIRASWAAAREQMLDEEPFTHKDSIIQRAEVAAAYADANARRQEEILADEFVSSLPIAEQRAPRSGDSADATAPDVAWAIQFVE